MTGSEIEGQSHTGTSILGDLVKSLNDNFKKKMSHAIFKKKNVVMVRVLMQKSIIIYVSSKAN